MVSKESKLWQECQPVFTLLSDIQQRRERFEKSYPADTCMIHSVSLPADAGGWNEIHFMYANYDTFPVLGLSLF